MVDEEKGSEASGSEKPPSVPAERALVARRDRPPQTNEVKDKLDEILRLEAEGLGSEESKNPTEAKRVRLVPVSLLEHRKRNARSDVKTNPSVVRVESYHVAPATILGCETRDDRTAPGGRRGT